MKSFRELLYTLFAILLVGVVLTLVFPPKARAQDAPPQLCMAFADMAVVARSLAIEKIEPAQATRIMRSIYNGPAMTPEVVAAMDGITSYARQSKAPPSDFAGVVLAMCMHRGTPI